MKVDLIIQSGSTIFYPAVEEGITLDLERKGSPGKLKFSVVKDDVISFQEGDAVKLAVDGTDIFYGFVFTKSRSGQSPYLIEVTAYDQLRYFKNKDTYVYSNKKANEVIQMIAEDFGLQVGTLEDTGTLSRRAPRTTLRSSILRRTRWTRPCRPKRSSMCCTTTWVSLP